MYERATITYAGKASSLVFGISMHGTDPDGRDFPFHQEFIDDDEDDDDCAVPAVKGELLQVKRIAK